MNINVFWRKNRKNKDGMTPIYLRFNCDQNVFMIATNIASVYKPDGFIMQANEPDAIEKSIRLKELIAKCENYLQMNEYHKPIATIKRELTELVTGKRYEPPTIVETFDLYTKNMKIGTQKIYMQTKNKLLLYQDSVRFNEVDKQWLERFEVWLRQNGAKVNGISLHMRNLRAIYNYALDEDMTENYPFRKFKIRNEQTRKRDLTKEQLRMLRDYPCPTHEQRKARDLFMLMFYLCGINIGDLLRLTDKNVNNGRIEYHRRKTGKYYSIKIEPETQAIIDKYKGERYLLDILDTTDDAQKIMSRTNKRLKQIGMTYKHGCGWMGTPLFPYLSTYYARHSWASIASEIDVPIDVIGQALGHTSPYHTTDIYVNRRLSKIDKANRDVIDYLNDQQKKRRTPITDVRQESIVSVCQGCLANKSTS